MRRFLFLPICVFLFSCSTPYTVDKGMEIAVKHDQERQREFFNQKLLQAMANVGEVEYRLGPGDVILVSIFGIEELKDMEGQLDSGGDVYLPLVGKIHLGGLTVSQAQKELEKAYSRYIRHPRVSIVVKEYKSYRVSVLGRVNKPDVYILRGGRTLLDVLAMAGGLADDASHTVILISPSRKMSKVIDLDSLVVSVEGRGKVPVDTLVINPGDIVYVPRAESIFVDGYVNKPGSFPLTTQLTLTQAIALAGGMMYEADQNNVCIYRLGKDGKRYVIKVDLAKVRSGEMEDPVLQKDDVVLVPSSGARVFVQKFLGFFGVGFSNPRAGYSMRVGR